MLNKDGGESNEHFKLQTSYINVFKEGENILQKALYGATTFIFALSQRRLRELQNHYL